MEIFPQNPTTIFVDNLPQHIRKIWLYNLFIKFGKISDLFIPSKKSKITGQNFGFVRFFKREDAEVAIAQTNDSWRWDHRLIVKFARFLKKKDDQGMGRKPFSNSFFNKHKQNPHIPSYKRTNIGGNPYFNSSNYTQKRGKEVWRRKGTAESSIQGEQRNAKTINNASYIKVQPAGNDWLLRSAIAKINKLVSPADLIYIFRKEGVHNIQIKPIGGRFLIVIFPDGDLRNSTIKKRWLSNWFEEIKPWNGEQAKEERFVRLSCFGMPLNAWSAPTFRDIGNVWGHFLQVDECTLNEESYEKGSILIASDHIHKIEGYVELEIGHDKYSVRVEEVETFRFIKQSYFQISSKLDVVLEDESGEDDDMAKNKDEVENHVDLEIGDTENNKRAEVALPASPVDAAEIDSLSSPLGVEESVMGSGIIPDSFDENLNSNQSSDSFVMPNYVAQPCNFLETEENSYINALGSQGVNATAGTEEKTINDDNISEDLGNETIDEGNNTDPTEVNHNSIQATVKCVKGKKKRKNIDEILGFSKINPRRRNKNKCVVLRSAVAAAALTSSVSSGGINNRNKILLDEAQTIWAVNKIMGLGYDGDEDEVISRIADMNAQNIDRAECHL